MDDTQTKEIIELLERIANALESLSGPLCAIADSMEANARIKMRGRSTYPPD